MNSKSSTNKSSFFVCFRLALLCTQHYILSFVVRITYHSSCRRILLSVKKNKRKKNGAHWVGYKSSRTTNLLDTHVAELCLGNICEGYFKCIVLKAKKPICINFFHFALEVQRNSIFKAKYHHRLHISLCNHLTTKVMTHKEKIYHDIYHFSWVQLNYVS